MSWKPGRGNNILLDKHINRDHNCYFDFLRETDKMERSKIAYKWYVSAKYLNNLRIWHCSTEDFKNECLKNPKRVYKRFLDLIQDMEEKKQPPVILEGNQVLLF